MNTLIQNARLPFVTVPMNIVGWGLMLVALALAPLVVYPMFIIKALCFALFASAFNLLLGYGGMLSIGHAAFFGMAAYSAGYASKSWMFTPELSILFGALVGAVLGLIFGLFAIRRSGIYLAMITLALAQMVFFFALKAPFTGGEDGLQEIPRGSALGLFPLDSMSAIYVFVAIVFLAGIGLVSRILASPFGEVLAAVRENERKTTSLGYDAQRYKLLAFTLSAALSGAAGSTKAIAFGLASLTDVHWMLSGEVILMVLIGGVATFWGPIVGAFVLIALESMLGGVGEWFMMVQGGVFILCVLLFRKGIVGTLQRKPG